ncbi:alpha/beta hydrolase [Cytophaga aurantiaca]|uniref:alpha/beta hydrolase n=1 Tax=Cytophaga aurantiaca TaxID=29530 RepID=UPI0003758D66|nr:alpha/beta hydrolase [Cytophaga aurantiaca]
MKKNICYVLLSTTILFFASCTKKNDDAALPKSGTTQTKTNANLRLSNADAIMETQGTYTRTTTYDPAVYIPDRRNTSAFLNMPDNGFTIRYFPKSKSEPTPLIIAIHGGGFIGGYPFEIPVTVPNAVAGSNPAVSNPYDVITLEQLNEQGYALASIEYTFMNSNKKVKNADGTLSNLSAKNTLQDCKDFLDYIIAHAEQYNINPNKIILLGTSGGASASLWLGLDNTKNYANNIKGIIAMSPQATLNIPTWRDKVFIPTGQTAVFDKYYNPYNPDANFGGYNQNQYYKLMYGTNDVTKINEYSDANNLNFLGMIDSSDPELLLACFYDGNKEIVHSYAHVLALKVRASNRGLKARIAYINSTYNNNYYYYDPSENAIQFCIRKFQ